MRRCALALCLFAMLSFGAELPPVGGLSTTTPVTQDRDHAIYDWQVNALLAIRLKGIPWLTFRDFDRSFRGQDGAPEAKLFSDGVHINAQGYEILGAELRAELLPLLK